MAAGLQECHLLLAPKEMANIAPQTNFHVIYLQLGTKTERQKVFVKAKNYFRR